MIDDPRVSSSASLSTPLYILLVHFYFIYLLLYSTSYCFNLSPTLSYFNSCWCSYPHPGISGWGVGSSGWYSSLYPAPVDRPTPESRTRSDVTQLRDAIALCSYHGYSSARERGETISVSIAIIQALKTRTPPTPPRILRNFYWRSTKAFWG